MYPTTATSEQHRCTELQCGPMRALGDGYSARARRAPRPPCRETGSREERTNPTVTQKAIRNLYKSRGCTAACVQWAAVCWPGPSATAGRTVGQAFTTQGTAKKTPHDLSSLDSLCKKIYPCTLVPVLPRPWHSPGAFRPSPKDLPVTAIAQLRWRCQIIYCISSGATRMARMLAVQRVTREHREAGGGFVSTIPCPLEIRSY